MENIISVEKYSNQIKYLFTVEKYYYRWKKLRSVLKILFLREKNILLLLTRFNRKNVAINIRLLNIWNIYNFTLSFSYFLFVLLAEQINRIGCIYNRILVGDFCSFCLFIFYPSNIFISHRTHVGRILQYYKSSFFYSETVRAILPKRVFNSSESKHQDCFFKCHPSGRIVQFCTV